MGMLFRKECKKTLLSVTFWLYVVTVILMYGSQFGEALGEPLEPPGAGRGDYGSIVKEAPEILMPAAAEGLVEEYLRGSYIAYPFLFYKEVKLSADKTAQMAGIIQELTGMSAEELNAFAEYEAVEIRISKELTYERFRELMQEADRLIGGGSQYGTQFLMENFSRVPMDYEDALAEYEGVVADSNIASAYTRLYCDYLGIVLSVLPVFVCVSLWTMDRRVNMESLVYGRSCSSVKLVGIRYLALTVCMSIPVLLTYVHAMWSVWGLYPDKQFAWGQAFGLMAIWLFPNILIVSALGALLSELVSPLIVIFLQAAWWFLSISANRLTGSITKWTLVIRHNSLYKTELFRSQFENFVVNRCAYLVLSLLCVGLTMFLYDRKRKGVLLLGTGGSGKNHRKVQSNPDIR